MSAVVYGPYTRKDGRKHVIHYDRLLKTRRTQSYPRYLMELHLGRALELWEHVDHINEDFTDDRVENFQLLTAEENILKSIVETGRSAKQYNFTCPICNEPSSTSYRRYNHNQIIQGKSGPYCSKKCSGKASHLAGVLE